jgi:hypothetical protein
MPRRARIAVVLVLVVAAAGAIAGCDRSPKREAVALANAVDRCRKADGASRPREVKAVEDVPCTAEDVCAAKMFCAEAVARTAEALAIKDRVAQRLDDIEAKRLAVDDPEAEALPAQLDMATRLLGQGRVKMSLCDSRLAELTVKYR